MQSLPQSSVTNPGLLGDLLSVCPEGANVLGAAFRGDPHQATRGQWFAHKAAAGTVWGTGAGPELNKYLCVSAFSDVIRRKDTFVCQLALMVDDLGGTIPLDKLPADLSPTWLIETSPSNYQAWYVFADPITDRATAEALVMAVQAKGFCKADGKDTGFVNVTRYGRCDRGVNAKLEALDKHGKPWQVRGERQNGLVTVQEVLDAFGITAADLKNRRKKDAAAGVGPQSDLELTEAMEGDTLAQWLAEQGLVKRWRDDGWLDITCPWVEDHTGGDSSGTAYRLARFSGSGKGGFKCHHGSHIDRTLVDLWEWAEGEGWQNPWSVPDAVDEFEPLDENGEPVVKSLKEQLAERYVWVPAEGKFFDFETQTLITSSSLERFVSAIPGIDHVKGKDNVHLFGFYEMEIVTDEKGKTEQKRVFYKIGTWLAHKGKRVVEGMTWIPGAGRIVVKDNGKSYANSYAVPPMLLEMQPEGDISPWLALLEHIVPEPEYRNAIIDWLAHQVQFPGIKRNWHLLLGGGTRIGKDSVFQPVFRAMGGLCRQTGEKEIKSEFQDYLVHKLLVVFQEVATLHERMATEDGMKPLLVNQPEVVAYTVKGRGSVEQPNVVNVIAMSNREMPLHISKDDERWFPYWSHAEKLAPNIYAEYQAWLNKDGVQAVVAYLQRREIRSDFYSAPPVTSWKESLMGASGGGLAVTLRGLIEAKKGVFGLDLVREADVMEAMRAVPEWQEASLVAKRNAMNEAGIVQAKDTVIREGNSTRKICLRTLRNASLYNSMTGKEREAAYWTQRLTVGPLLDKDECGPAVSASEYARHREAVAEAARAGG
jgi:hypothetical protein